MAEHFQKKITGQKYKKFQNCKKNELLCWMKKF